MKTEIKTKRVPDNALVSRLVQFIDKCTDSICKYPDMWGPPLAAELQLLLALEFKAAVLRPELVGSRTAMTIFARFMNQRLRMPGNRPLSDSLVSAGREAEFSGLLTEFCEEFNRQLEEHK